MKILALYHMYVARIAALLAVVVAVSVFLYGTFLLMAVAHAAKMSDAQHDIRVLTGTLSTAESQYLAATNAISFATATQMGLVKPTSVVIISAAKAAGLTLNR